MDGDVKSVSVSTWIGWLLPCMVDIGCLRHVTLLSIDVSMLTLLSASCVGPFLNLFYLL